MSGAAAEADSELGNDKLVKIVATKETVNGENYIVVNINPVLHGKTVGNSTQREHY